MPDDLRLTVPLASRESLMALAEEDPARVENLAAELSGRQTLLTPEEIEEKVREHLPRVAANASALVGTLGSLIAQVDASEATNRQVAHAVANDLGLRRLDDEKVGQLENAVAVLIGAPDFRLAAKAADVVTEYEHVFLRARIFTDVRPVFRDNDVAEPAGAVIIQTLKIEHYGEDGNVRSFFVSLDQADLISLKKVVERALDKAKSVKGILESAELASWRDHDDGTY